MHARTRLLTVTLARRSLLALALAGGAVAAMPAQAQVKGLEIIASAGPGGVTISSPGRRRRWQAKGLASGVQVVNVPGAGGTIGLAQFVTKTRAAPA